MSSTDLFAVDDHSVDVLVVGQSFIAVRPSVP